MMMVLFLFQNFGTFKKGKVEHKYLFLFFLRFSTYSKKIKMAPIKVIGASLGRCGTDSMRVALDMLG